VGDEKGGGASLKLDLGRRAANIQTPLATHLPCRTLNAPVELTGRGLFTGVPVGMRVLPRDAAGIVFRLVSGAQRPIEAPALTHYTRPIPGQHYTQLVAAARDLSGTDGEPPAVAMTIEHVVAALAGLGISNATVELDQVEVPMMDGSARPLVEAILSAGVRELTGQSREALVVDRTIRVGDADAWIEASPTDAPAELQPLTDFEYRLDYGPGAPIRPSTERFIQYHAGEIASGSVDCFATQIAPARTFNTLAQAEAFRRAGLFQHLTYEDVLVIGPDGPVGTVERLEGEPARHKVLDMIGDLALVGRPIFGRICGYRSGHYLNHRLAEALLAMLG
jgi:UDP-3-O-acyl-N-acetylglucosamine deacetylase